MGDGQTKILLVSNTSFFLHNFLQGLMKRFREERFDVVGLAPPDVYSEKLTNNGFRLVPISRLDRKGSNPLHDVKLMLELRRIYRQERPNLVLHFTIKLNVYGSIAARLAGTKSVCTVTGLGWLFTDKGLKARLGSLGYKVLYRIAFSFSKHVVFLNKDDRAFFLGNGLAKDSRSSVIPGAGVNTENFDPGFCGAAGRNLPVLSMAPGLSFLLIGRMLWDKGVGEFVEAASIVKQREPDTRFLLLGPIDKENRSAIPEAVIAEWESKDLVHYLGRTDDVRPYLCATDAIVLPSYREGIPSALLEAMAMGKPVITTNTPGCRDVLDDGKNGFIAPERDARALADCMLRFIALSQDERRAMGKYARERVLREFDEKVIVGSYLQLITNAMRS